MKKKILILILGLFLISFISAEQVLWDNDTNIEVYDTWEDIDGTPLTGATCTWYVYNPNGVLNQSGSPDEFALGIINFTVTQLPVVETYPMFINCTKNTYNGTSSLREIKIVDELSEEYKIRLEEINQTTQSINDTVEDINITVTEINITTHEIYNLLLGNIMSNLTNILNLTTLTYNNTLNLEIDIGLLDNSLTSLRTYLESKWGNEDANKIYDKIKDIRHDVTFLRSRYSSITEVDREALLLSIREDSREVLDLMYGKDKWWEGVLIWLIPALILLIIIISLILYLSKKKKKEIEDFGGHLNEN